jgi:hypothetical protein
MIGLEFTKVAKAAVPDNKRMVLGKYQRFFKELMFLPSSVTACVEMQCKKDGYNATNELRKMSKKEGLILGWSHNATYTKFYYWLERPKAGKVAA